MRVKAFAVIVVACSLFACLHAQSQRPPDQQTKPTQTVAAPDPRGSETSPVVVKILPAPQTHQEAADEKAQRQDESDANWAMVKLTGAIFFLGIAQLVASGLQTRRVSQTIHKMDEIARSQTADTKASIAEATRAAKAMDAISASMATSVESVKRSLEINEQIAATQKLVTILQSRAYLHVSWAHMNVNNVADEWLFQGNVRIDNKGSTPAYKVRFNVAADILPVPLPDTFTFPLPDTIPHGSLTEIGPGLSRVSDAVVPGLHKQDDANWFTVGQGPDGQGRAIYMWGKITYEDAFGTARYTRFAFHCIQINTEVWKSSDCSRHNESN